MNITKKVVEIDTAQFRQELRELAFNTKKHIPNSVGITLKFIEKELGIKSFKMSDWYKLLGELNLSLRNGKYIYVDDILRN
jgi:hypothetical protein